MCDIARLRDVPRRAVLWMFRIGSVMTDLYRCTGGIQADQDEMYDCR